MTLHGPARPCGLVWCFAVQHALALGVVGGVEPEQHLFERAVRVDVDAEHFGGDAAVEALDHAICLRRSRPDVAVLRAEGDASFGKAGVKQLLLSVSTWVSWKGRAAAASRRKAMALCSVSSSLTARWTAREQRSMATNRYLLRRSPSPVCSLGRCLTSMWTKLRS